MKYTGFIPYTEYDSPDIAFTPEVFGGKGAGLFELKKLGAPVPEFVVIPTSLCVEYMANPAAVETKLKQICKDIVQFFIDDLGCLPLLSVRSGARVSMPGMMDTILNIGWGDKHSKVVTDKMTPWTKHDCGRRLVQMFGNTVYGIPNEEFDQARHSFLKKHDVQSEAELSGWLMGNLRDRYAKVLDDYGVIIPKRAVYQLYAAILAVMQSWNSDRAREYRKLNNIPDDWGTAVVIQRMVFGNLNDQSGSGVLFTRDPMTGGREIMAEFLYNAQGEDVVAGIRTPEKLDLHYAKSSKTGLWGAELYVLCNKLEDHYRDMLDIEFTVEDGKLYLLQVRVAKRSARAWIRTSLDMLDECLITSPDVFERVKREHIRQLFKPVIAPWFDEKENAVGIPACGGVVSGRAVFTSEAAVASEAPCILIRKETSPEDIAGMNAAVGVLTQTGGTTSHAAVVARGMDKPCVVGCTDIQVSEVGCSTQLMDIAEGDIVTIDGDTGRVWFLIEVPTIDASSDDLLEDITVFALGEKKDSTRKQLALPGTTGTVYSVWQLWDDAPEPGGSEVDIIVDKIDPSDLVFICTGRPTEEEIVMKVKRFAKKHNVHVNLYMSQGEVLSDGGSYGDVTVVPMPSGILDNLLSRPCTRTEIETALQGSMLAVEKLIAPASIDDKFDIVECQRYDLLAKFK